MIHGKDIYSWYRHGLMVQTWTHGIDMDSWYKNGLMVQTRTNGIDLDSWYRHGIMVQTWTHGIDMDSWYRHGLMVLITPMVLVLLNQTRTRGLSLARMQVFFLFIWGYLFFDIWEYFWIFYRTFHKIPWLLLNRIIDIKTQKLHNNSSFWKWKSACVVGQTFQLYHKTTRETAPVLTLDIGGKTVLVGFEQDEGKVSMHWGIEGQGFNIPSPFTLCYLGGGVFSLPQLQQIFSTG